MSGCKNENTVRRVFLNAAGAVDRALVVRPRFGWLALPDRGAVLAALGEGRAVVVEGELARGDAAWLASLGAKAPAATSTCSIF